MAPAEPTPTEPQYKLYKYWNGTSYVFWAEEVREWRTVPNRQAKRKYVQMMKRKHKLNKKTKAPHWMRPDVVDED